MLEEVKVEREQIILGCRGVWPVRRSMQVQAGWKEYGGRGVASRAEQIVLPGAAISFSRSSEV